MNKPKILITAPVHIPVSDEWAWSLEAVAKTSGADVLIIDDSDGNVTLPESFMVFDYTQQEAFLGTELYKKFKQFHYSSACKQLGLLYGYLKDYDYVIVIDSDCIVNPSFVARHIEQLGIVGDGWENPLLEVGVYSRGFPYSKRKKTYPIVSMGLWEHELDLYGKDRMDNLLPNPTYPGDINKQAFGIVPLSGMNVCFAHHVIPAILFLPSIHNLSRHDDIWGGYVLQQFMRKRGDVLRYGPPIVYHDTIVDAAADAKAEEPMIEQEDAFYTAVDTAMRSVNVDTYENMMKQFTSIVSKLAIDDVLKDFTHAYKFWTEALYNE